MIGLVMATHLEAQPVIDGLGLSLRETQPVQIYVAERIGLVVTGIGKTNAAMGTAVFIERCNPDIVCNLGAAGALGYGPAQGDVFQIDRIVEPDRPDLKTDLPKEHQPDCIDGFPRLPLATHDHAVRTVDERNAVRLMAELADMEGAAVAQVCRRFARPCYLFKYVSDTPDHTNSQDIIASIELYRDAFFLRFRKEILPVLLGLVGAVHQP